MKDDDLEKRDDLETRFSRRLRRLREENGSSQQSIADAMNVRMGGGRWLQTTVAKTEAAQRPIRLNEAAHLAEVFGFSLADVLNQIGDAGTALFAEDLTRAVARHEVEKMIEILQQRAEALRPPDVQGRGSRRWMDALLAARDDGLTGDDAIRAADAAAEVFDTEEEMRRG